MVIYGLPWWLKTVKNLPAMRKTWVQFLDQEDPPEEGMATHSSGSCLENPHGQRSLAGYSPWGHTELDTAEVSKQQEQQWSFIVFNSLAYLL